ncbi:MAG: transglycosylase SLT domain-containing protein [Clostridia bacterium]|nr:transglycosylase SLT domain-containing protein [Clostridia bacterium]
MTDAGRRKGLRAVAVIGVVLLSLAGGLVYRKFAENAKKAEYPRKYEAIAAREAELACIPESAVYAVMKTVSDFDPAFSSKDGRSGLFGLTPELFSALASEKGESTDPRLLYDPEVSIGFGCFWFGQLYREYRSWEAVFTCYAAGRDAVERQITEDGGFDPSKYPSDVAALAKKLGQAMKTYEKLYPETGDETGDGR